MLKETTVGLQFQQLLCHLHLIGKNMMSCEKSYYRWHNYGRDDVIPFLESQSWEPAYIQEVGAISQSRMVLCMPVCVCVCVRERERERKQFVYK